MNANRVRLADPTPDFNRFADDQVLTAEQLNRLIDYLIDQQRGTRTRLLGSGIVCGLELGRQDDNVTLNQGIGLSSDGDLMTVQGDRIYSQFRAFDDAHAQYPEFRVAGQLLPMWELFEDGSVEPELRPLAEFDTLTQGQGGGFDNVQALLYLEHFLEPFELCNAEDCDNRGPREAMTPRVLLVQRAPGLVDPPPHTEYFNLPLVEVPRVAVNGVINRYDGNNGLASRFVSAIEDLREQLSAAFAQAAGGAFAADIEALDVNGQSWSELLNNDPRFLPGNNDRRVQYVYAFFQDLADAWHEWRECLLDIGTDCLPDPADYPRHLLLGEPAANPAGERRHRYHPGPVQRRNDAELHKARLLLRRIQQMISFFAPAAFNNANAIRLTPSRDDGHLLGERAIPFYYNPSDQRPLFHNWDPEATRRRRERFIPSYFAADYIPASQPGAQPRDPWAYHRGGVDFIRIEGHLGQEVDAVQQRLTALRRSINLAFQVLAVQLEDREDRVRLPPKLRFPDLEIFFHVYQSDIASNLREARSYNQNVRQQLAAVDDSAAADEVAGADLIAGNLEVALRGASASMPRSVTQCRDLGEDETTAFTNQLSAGLNSAGTLGAATVNLLRPTRETPIQRFADGARLRQFGLIKELFDKHRRRVRQRSIFTRFVAENPGLEHRGGVEPGGTFVLVYAADDGEVLADFTLPYYSTFDISTLEPEQIDPEPVDPGAPPPAKPPYVLTVPEWGSFNKSPVFTLQGKRVHDQVTRLTGVNDGLTNFLFGVNVGEGGTVTVPETGFVRPGGGGGFDFGLGGTIRDPRVTDPLEQLILTNSQKLRNELLDIQTRVDQGLALTRDTQRAAEIDSELAELVVQGTQLARLQGDDASLSAGDRAFIRELGITAVTIRADSARTMVADRLDAINAAPPNSLLVGNLGSLVGAIRPR